MINVNPLIMQAQSVLSVPVYPNKCNDPLDEYIVFNYLDERPIFWADDEEQEDLTPVQVHWFTKENPQPKKKALRRFLRSQGFDILSTQEFFEDDTKLNHIVVECEISGAIDDNEHESEEL